MKTVFNAILAICIVALVYICYASIMGPINFQKEKDVRDAAVQTRLIDIRKAQEQYRNLHNQQYTDNFDSLIHFVKTEKIPFVFKQGELSDAQLESGMTEKKAMDIIKKGDAKAIAEAGLQNFRRDTNWIAVVDTLFGQGYNADSLRFVPFGNGAQFEMDTITQVARSGAPFCLLEVKTPYTTYLNGLDKQEIVNLIDEQTQLGRYAGLKIGDLETANNNAGNWE
jgi:ribosomal protein L22